MPRCVFTDGAECCKCVICYHYKYKCVNCGYEGAKRDDIGLHAQRCDNCGSFIGIKECPKVQDDLVEEKQ